MSEDEKSANVDGSVPARLIKNTLSQIGLAVAVIAFANIVFLFLVDLISTTPNPYIGVLTYMVMPGFLLFGLLMVVVGALLERRRRFKGQTDTPRLPRIDLNNPKQRNSVAFLLSFLVIFALLSAVGSFKAYKATESVSFCGQSCHALYPEFTAYSVSPHAKVACVDCHVGPGASWYVRSKLSGLTELYATLRNTYPRPIPSPVKNLRPAQDTCEECH